MGCCQKGLDSEAASADLACCNAAESAERLPRRDVSDTQIEVGAATLRAIYTTNSETAECHEGCCGSDTEFNPNACDEGCCSVPLEANTGGSACHDGRPRQGDCCGDSGTEVLETGGQGNHLDAGCCAVAKEVKTTKLPCVARLPASSCCGSGAKDRCSDAVSLTEQNDLCCTAGVRQSQCADIRDTLAVQQDEATCDGPKAPRAELDTCCITTTRDGSDVSASQPTPAVKGNSPNHAATEKTCCSDHMQKAGCCSVDSKEEDEDSRDACCPARPLEGLKAKGCCSADLEKDGVNAPDACCSSQPLDGQTAKRCCSAPPAAKEEVAREACCTSQPLRCPEAEGGRPVDSDRGQDDSSKACCSSGPLESKSAEVCCMNADVPVSCCASTKPVNPSSQTCTSSTTALQAVQSSKVAQRSAVRRPACECLVSHT